MSTFQDFIDSTIKNYCVNIKSQFPIYIQEKYLLTRVVAHYSFTNNN